MIIQCLVPGTSTVPILNTKLSQATDVLIISIMNIIERRQPPDGDSSDSFFDEQVRLAQYHHDRGLDFCYAKPKDVDRALDELDTAIQMRESLLGKFHNDTALSYFRKASVLREDKKDYFSALVVARRELRILQQLQRETGNERDFLAARIEWIEQVLSCHQTSMSKGDIAKYSSQLLQTIEYERLGDQHFARKEWDLAITQYGCALALEASAYARNTLEMADMQVKIGDCYAGMEDFDAALEEYKNAREQYQCDFGLSPHSILGKLLNKCASLHLKQNEFDAALGAYAKAYSIYEQVLGKRHELSIEALQDIRLVTVKEMEELRKTERLRKKEVKGAGYRFSQTQRERGAIEDKSDFSIH
jgi:tetratricopeptide (TPR) repeat protein